MYGINLENYNSLLKKSINSVDLIEDEAKELKKTIKSLEEVYDGKCLTDLFHSITSQTANIDKIQSVLESYISFMQTVKSSYIAQDISFSQQLNQKSQKL